MAFVELHARSAFSFLRGSSSPEALVTRAAELGMSHIAITDRDGFYGSARAHYKARELGMKAIVGVELTMEDGAVQPLLVATRAGYQNLCELITTAKLRAAKGQSRVLWSELAGCTEGLIALGGDGEEGPPAMLHIERLVQLFGRERVLVEVQRHHLRGETLRNRRLIEAARHHGARIVATNGPFHAAPEGRLLMDAFTALRHHTHLDEAGLRLAANSQRHLKGTAEMRGLFADLPEAIENAARVVDEIEYSLENLGYEFPSYAAPEGHDQTSFLRELSYAGARDRYGEITQAVRKQLEHELRIIGKLGFEGYFLVVWDLVRFAKEHGIFVQGRGSAANSAVCYCLGITNADPVGGKLLFERFLSEGRRSWPDIDLDLPSGERRESVIQELYRRFAPHGAAMTANVITYRGRSAIREMGRALNLPEDITARFGDLYPHGDFPHTLELQEQLRSAGMPAEHPRLHALVRLYRQAYGLPRHLGQHSGGMVLCSKGLHKIVPLEPASMPGRVVVQWDKDDCEDLGIIKVDLLGLGMLAAIEETLATCAVRGRPVDLAKIPKDDPATYEMMTNADTVGLFQIESRAQMATLPRMKPRCFYDVVIEVAIIRPGPIVGKLVHPYLNRRSGKEKIDLIDPRFEDVLGRTLGVPLFQEQVLQMAMIIADFSGAEAEDLRRAMSFHRSDERMQKVMQKLRAAMAERDVPLATQESVVRSIQSFALYGFPESHAISFALIAYASAWLKAHRAAEFYAALLNCQPMGFYSSATLVRDAKLHGLRVKPVCIVLSAACCTVEDDHTIRLGLNQLRGISHATIDQLLAERARRPWADVDDLLLRCPIAKDERRVLAQSGALNGLGLHRRSALWEVETTRELDLFTRLQDAGAEKAPLAAMTPVERLESDYKAMELTTGPHPMAYARETLSGVWRAAELSQAWNGQRVTVAGQVICRQRPGTAKGHVFVSLEDETGISNIFVPSAAFEAQRLVITQEPFLIIHGRMQHADGVASVFALKVEALRFEARVHAESHDFH